MDAMDESKIRDAFAIWGTDWDALSPEVQAQWKKEIDIETGTESHAYGINMLEHAKDAIVDPKFRRALKVPGALIAVSQMQAVMDGLLKDYYGTSPSPLNHTDNRGKDLVIGINTTITVAVAIGFLLRVALDATDEFEQLYLDEQEPEQ